MLKEYPIFMCAKKCNPMDIFRPTVPMLGTQNKTLILLKFSSSPYVFSLLKNITP